MTSRIDSPAAPSAADPRHQVNQQWWDEVTPVHARSEFYDVPGFLNGRSALDKLERELLGDLSGLSVLHLQCHFGMSTIELARMGARAVGVDFSEPAIVQARDLARQAGQTESTSFVCCDVLELDRHLHDKFDVVFASYGVITWIFDLRRWMEIAAHFLKPGGKLVFIEIHPTALIFEAKDGKPEITFDYFHNPAGVELEGESDYADPKYYSPHKTIEFQWSLADIFKSLTAAGMTLQAFDEYPFSCFAHLPGMTKREDGFYYLPEGSKQLPFLFSLKAIRSTLA